MSRRRTDARGTAGRGAFALAAALALGGCLSGVPPKEAERPAGKAKAGSPPARATKPADNSYCFVCHANYKEEKLTVTHQRAGVGCETCHGPSDRHSADEDALTPPDILFPKAKIAPACMACHPADALLKQEIHRPVLAPDAPEKKVCTDCHGDKHRLKVRTRRWDKETGKLIKDDGVRMMYKGSPAGSAR